MAVPTVELYRNTLITAKENRLNLDLSVKVIQVPLYPVLLAGTNEATASHGQTYLLLGVESPANAEGQRMLHHSDCLSIANAVTFAHTVTVTLYPSRTSYVGLL